MISESHERGSLTRIDSSELTNHLLTLNILRVIDWLTASTSELIWAPTGPDLLPSSGAQKVWNFEATLSPASPCIMLYYAIQKLISYSLDYLNLMHKIISPHRLAPHPREMSEGRLEVMGLSLPTSQPE